MLAAMLFLGITATSAQEIRDMFGTDQKGEIAYGVRAGLNISNIGGKYGPAQDLDHNSRVGFRKRSADTRTNTVRCTCKSPYWARSAPMSASR